MPSGDTNRPARDRDRAADDAVSRLGDGFASPDRKPAAELRRLKGRSDGFAGIARARPVGLTRTAIRWLTAFSSNRRHTDRYRRQGTATANRSGRTQSGAAIKRAQTAAGGRRAFHAVQYRTPLPENDPNVRLLRCAAAFRCLALLAIPVVPATLPKLRARWRAGDAMMTPPILEQPTFRLSVNVLSGWPLWQ